MGSPFDRYQQQRAEQQLVDQVSGRLTTDPDLVAQLHAVSDRDASPLALHHTLGRSARQSSPGDHTHDGTSSATLDPSDALAPATAAGTILVGNTTGWTELAASAGDHFVGTGTGLALCPPPGAVAPVKAVRTTNLSVSSPGTPTADGVTIGTAGDRVLLVGQTAAAENGVWVWTSAGTALTRPPDADLPQTLRGGILVPVLSGTSYAGTIWRHTTTTVPLVIGTTTLSFALVQDAGSELKYAEITAASAAFTTIADITGLTITFTLTSTRKVMLVFSGLVRSSVANDLIEITIADSSNTVLATTANVFIAAVNSNHRAHAFYRTTLAAGTYTYKIRGTRNAGTGSCIVNANATNPAFIQAVDLGP